MGLNRLYELPDYQFENSTPPVTTSFSFDGDVLRDAMRRLYEKKYNPLTQIDEGLFNEFWDIYNRAADAGLRSAPVPMDFNDKDADFYNALQRNNGVFSAFKTHRFANDMAKQLIGEDGNLKSFDQWERDTESIRRHHVRHWLEAEYNTAVRRAHLAAQWRQFEREKDIFPNLEWIETTSLNPGKDHIPFWGVILPIDAPFWDRHRPGDRWNCKCDLQNTDKPINPPSGAPEADSPENAPATGLENNPGKDAMLFSQTHPYLANGHLDYRILKPIVNRFVNRQTAKRQAERKRIEENRKKYEELLNNPNYHDVKFNPKNGGLMAIHKEHRFDSEIGSFGIARGEYEKRAANVLFQNGRVVILESEKAASGIKTPDGFLDGKRMDIKGIESAGDTNIRNSLLSARKQEVETVVLYFHDGNMFSKSKVSDGWQKFIDFVRDKDFIRDKAIHINRVVCVVDDNVIDAI